MTAQEQIEALTTNLKASLALNNLRQAQIAATQKKRTTSTFLSRVKKFLS